jgi:CheY-like chemotaxis protein
LTIVGFVPSKETMMAERDHAPATVRDPFRVLVADNDLDVSELVEAILTDEGYEVTVLQETDHASIAAAVGQIEPDCILLDGAEGPQFGGSWSEAAYLATRARAVPTVMFTAHADAVHEARTHTSDRASAARFAAIVAKPFGLDTLLDAVATATGQSARFDRSAGGERRRTAELRSELRAAGATDIRTSDRREWATFVSPSDRRIYQLYWWQRLGRYVVGRYDDTARLEMVGQFLERRAAVEAALQPSLTR